MSRANDTDVCATFRERGNGDDLVLFRRWRWGVSGGGGPLF